MRSAELVVGEEIVEGLRRGGEAPGTRTLAGRELADAARPGEAFLPPTVATSVMRS